MTSDFGRKVFSVSKGNVGSSSSSGNGGLCGTSINSSESSDETTVWCGNDGFRHKEFRSYKAS